MACRTRQSQKQLPIPLEDAKRMARLRRTVVAPPSSDETSCPMERAENRLGLEEVMAGLLEEAPVQSDADRKSQREPQSPLSLCYQAALGQRRFWKG